MGSRSNTSCSWWSNYQSQLKQVDDQVADNKANIADNTDKIGKNADAIADNKTKKLPTDENCN